MSPYVHRMFAVCSGLCVSGSIAVDRNEIAMRLSRMTLDPSAEKSQPTVSA